MERDTKKTKAQLIAELQALREAKLSGLPGALEATVHLNSVLHSIRDINQLIVHESDPQRLLEGACNCLVNTRGYNTAWLTTFDEQGRAHLLAEAGFGDAWEGFSEGLRRGDLPTCARRAIQTSEVQITDKQSDVCRECPMNEVLDTHQTLAARLMHEGQLYGVMTVTISNDNHPLDEAETSLFLEIAGDISFALHSIKMDRLHEQSQEKFRLITESSPDAIFITDREGTYTYVNGAASRLLGYSVQELTGMSIADVSLREHLERHMELFHNILEEGSVFTEIELVHKDGTLIPVDLNSVLLPDGSIYGSCRDLTERRQAENLLRASEANHRRAQRVAHIGHWELCSPEGTPIWSDEVFRIFGLDPGKDAPSFTAHHTIVHPEEWSLLDAAIRTGFAEGKPFDLTFRILRPDHETGWIRSIGKAQLDDQGRVIKMFGTAQDITEQKRIEESLRDARQLLEGILDSIPVRVFWKDENLVYLGCNAVFARDAGLTCPQDLIGKDDYQLVWIDQAELYREDDRQVMESGQPKLLIEEPQTTPAGDTITLLTSKLPLLSPSGETAGVLGIYQDITEVKRMQAQIAQSDRLASMGMLAAGVAHEINNPLAYVLYNLDSLTEDLPPLTSALGRILGHLSKRLDHEALVTLLGSDLELLNPSALVDIGERFRDALEGASRIKEVARGLATFSRVERDHLVPVNLSQTIEVAINMTFNEIKYRARLVKDYGKTATILANEGRLSQVFLNILINAAHAIAEGDLEGNEIRVRTWQEGDEVFVEVSDSGNGIAAENLPKLFEPFFTTKDVGVGTGLGLPISKKIVEEYGGKISVESAVGRGTRFIVCLPVGGTQEHVEAAGSAALLAQPEVRGRILVVDDEAGIRGVLVRLLRGHQVVEAVSGEAACEILETDQAFDLILCDIMMPAMSGVDLHKWITAKNPALADQVVFITGGAFTPRAREYLARVKNLRIEKPFDATNFKKIVRDRIIVSRQQK